MKILALIAFMCVVILTSCFRYAPCAMNYITPAFIGFNLSDLDSIIVRQYNKDGNFLQLIDTTLITLNTSFLEFTSSGDTTFVLLNHISGEEKFIFPDHDWQIYIPSRNLTFSISNIISPQTEKSCFKCYCWDPINSFVQNTQTLIPQVRQIPGLGGYFNVTYIHL